MNPENTEIVLCRAGSDHWEYIIDQLQTKGTLIVYDKNEQNPLNPSSFLIKNHKFQIRPLINIGKECFTFIHHIIYNYNQLAPYTLFTSDDFFNHIKDIDRFLKYYDLAVTIKQQYKPYKCMRWIDKEPYSVFIENGILKDNHIRDASHNIITQVCKELDLQLPKSYTSEVASFFMVSREIIHKRPLEFYIKIYNWIGDNPKRNEEVMEYLWAIIFGDLK
jgi:hypothetical protein